MKSLYRYVLLTAAAVVFLLLSGCAGAYVGVGVHTPGPWIGPYGGPEVIVGPGRPVYPGYYPYKEDAFPMASSKSEQNKTGTENTDGQAISSK